MKKFNMDIPDKIFGVETLIIWEYVPLLGVGLVLLVSWSLLFSPKLGQISDINSKVKSMESETKLVQSKSSYLRSVDQEDLNKKSDLLANSLIKEKNSYYLVGVVKEIAAKSGYSVVSFSVSPGNLLESNQAQITPKSAKKKTGDDVVPLPLKVTLNGSSQNYDTLIKNLEKTIPVLSISSLQMKSGGGVMLVDMTVTAYYAGPRTNVTAAKLSLNDLMLSKEENQVLGTLENFDVLAKAGTLDETTTNTDGKSFTKYDREDPFSL